VCNSVFIQAKTMYSLIDKADGPINLIRKFYRKITKRK